MPQPLPAVEPSPTWIAIQPSPFTVVIDNVAIGQQGQLYASGFGSIENNLRHFAQWDGKQWVRLGKGFQTAGNTLVTDGLGYLYTDSLTDSAQGATTAIMRWDGARWQEITSNFSTAIDALQAGRISSNIPVIALAVDGENNLYAAGTCYYPTADHANELPMGFVAKWNQKTWTVLGQGFDKVNIYGLAVSPAGEVYISGEQPLTAQGNSSYIAHWNGKTWTQVNTSTLKTSQSIVLDKSGRLYAAGTDDGGVGVFVVYWDGTSWITVTNKVAGEAAAIFDMAVDQNGQLYISGSFDAVSSISARNIAYWDGNLWHALGDGLNERVNALALNANGELYAVGFFTQTADLPVRFVARWDGQKWHALGQ